MNWEVVKEYIAKGSDTAIGLAREFNNERINEEGERAFSDAIEIGISNTVSSLYYANVSDQRIIECLNKFWGISMDEAKKRILYEKRCAPIRELREYLVLQGMSEQELQSFMIHNKVVFKIKDSQELRALWSKPEKLMKLVQELKE